MRTCIIIDDEKNAREALSKIIERYLNTKIKILYAADSVKEGVFAINKYNPDIVFLDIEMPEENGFKLFDYFDIYNFEVIFTTAYKQYAIDAIKFAALDYLLKPINYIDLRDVLTRLEKKQNSSSNTEQIEAFLNNINGRKIAEVKYEGGTMYAQYILIYFEDGDILELEPQIDVSNSGIKTHIQYRICDKDGADKMRGWGMETDELEDMFENGKMEIHVSCKVRRTGLDL